jgi:two-component system cell cycle sensor histidine kinase/response regulator CckA
MVFSPRTDAAYRSVLIVDDEPSVLQVARRILSRRFDPVVAVTSAEAALTLLESGMFFDVIFCDFSMPGMSGRELFARLQAADPAQAERLVIISGATADESDEAFLRALDHRWLEKPMRAAELLLIATTVAFEREAA